MGTNSRYCSGRPDGRRRARGVGYLENLIGSLVACACLLFSSVPSAWADGVTVFAAASLKNALDEVAADFEDATGDTVTVSYAGSSALAWQISHGAPADIFISANADWMDRLQADGHIVPDTRVNLLGNTLVLIGHGAVSERMIDRDTDLTELLSGGRLAMALVDAVPAGIYGKTALQFLGLWDGVEPHVAQADNVRAALALVAAGEAPLGIVYATDAVVSTDISVIGTFPPASHPSIVYPAAIVAGRGNETAHAFLEYLQGDDAGATFRRHGFTVPE